MENENKDHPDQAIDTPVPDGEHVDTETWEKMREAWFEENSDEPASEPNKGSAHGTLRFKT